MTRIHTSPLSAAIVTALGVAAGAQAPSTSKFTPAMADRPEIKQALAHVDQQFDAQVAEWIAKCEAAAAGQKVKFEREYIQKSEAGGRPEQLADRLASPVVQTAVDVLKYLGVALIPNGAPVPTGSTDATVGVVHGVPSVAIGRSRGGNQHSLSEWADTESARTGAKQLILLLTALAGV
jgi:acetylornithine deacetylase/succinyl-diaminopimelate desuccinylase-like protein